MDGREHERSTIVFLGLTAPVVSLLSPGGVDHAALYLAGGLVGTFLLSPDIDLDKSRPSKRWGPLGVLWWPYRLLHPHRGASHSWVYGPLSRLLYLGGLATGGLALAGVPLEEAVGRLLAEAVGAWPALLGYWASQWAHLYQDRIRFRPF